MKKRTSICLTILLASAYSATTSDVNQSDAIALADQPIAEQENIAEKPQMEVPEVVLQIKYDKGELNKIYLAQFRKGPNEWTPSVATRSSLCADLCHAGLGGDSCGASCRALEPVGLREALTAADTNHTEQDGGAVPRVSVCPTLCLNGLGETLCGCPPAPVEQVRWGAVCEAFCQADRYVLGGCPVCAENASSTTTVGVVGGRSVAASRALSTVDGWAAWCALQCRQGQGGAACNCDRAPFQ